MKQILVQLDDRLASTLEKVVPGRSHKRSAFVRQALARALHEELERRTRAAYERWPDEPVAVEPRGWAAEDEAMHPERTDSEPATRSRAQPKARAKTRAQQNLPLAKKAASVTGEGRR